MTGFGSKQRMAADKDALFEKLEVEQPAQNPVTWFGIDFAKQYAIPAQEPVAWTLLLTGEHHGIIGEAGEKFIGVPECYQRVNVYTTPPKREWVGLTDEETQAYWDWEDWQTGAGRSTIFEMVKDIEAKLKERNG